MRAGRFIAGTAIVLLAGSQAYGQQVEQRPTMNIGQWYGGLEAGIIIPDDLSYSLSGPVNGVSTTISGNISFDTGSAVGAFVGYHFNDYFSGEGEFLYGNFDFDKLTANFTGALVGSGTESVNGSVDTETFLANGIITPFGRSEFTPYIGGSIGFANHDSNISSITGPNGTASVNSSDSGVDFAAGAIAGIDWAATDQWSLGARYRFLWVNLKLECPSGTTCSNGDLTAHVFTLNATYHFE